MPRRSASGTKTPVVLPGFTDNLNRIIAAYRWVDEHGTVTGYTTKTLAEKLQELGYDYTPVYIRQMLVGKRANPAAVLLAGLSRALGGIDIRVWFPQEYPEVHAAVLRDLDRQGEALKKQSTSQG